MIQVQTLGSFSIFSGGLVLPDRLGTRGREFAAYIMLNSGCQLSREKLKGMFWGDYDESTACRFMNTTLWRLRKILRDGKDNPSVSPLRCKSGHVCLDPCDAIFVDAMELSSCVSAAWSKFSAKTVYRDAVKVEILSQALTLYHGPFLEESEADWVIGVRQDLDRVFVRGLMMLKAESTLKGKFESAIDYTRRILCFDPHRETAQRDLMRLYVLNGQQAIAIQQYRSCCQSLKEEYGVNPMPQTTALYEHIRSGEIFSQLDSERSNIEAL